MSHYAVMVVGNDIDEKMRPYQELDLPDEQLKKDPRAIFEDQTEELTKEWKDDPEGFKTMDEWANNFGYSKNGDKYGNYLNPKAKWDWFEVGGRWFGMLKLKDKSGVIALNPSWGWSDTLDGRGEIRQRREEARTDQAYFKDIDFGFVDERRKKWYERFWEINIEGDERKEGEKPTDYSMTWKKEYYLDKYKTKKQYVEVETMFAPHAVITEDGVWHEAGKMGWFGFSGESDEDYITWAKNFKKNFLDTIKGNPLITIVDCHI